MSAITNAYDYFTPIETAWAKVFTDAGIATYTAANDPELQRERPRVEVELEPATAAGRLKPASDKLIAGGNLREQAYTATMNVRVITEANVATHRAFLAEVQYLCDAIVPALFATDLMPYHRVARVQATGGSVDYTPQDGIYNTQLTYEIEFSVLASALNALT